MTINGVDPIYNDDGSFCFESVQIDPTQLRYWMDVFQCCNSIEKVEVYECEAESADCKRTVATYTKPNSYSINLKSKSIVNIKIHSNGALI